MMKKLWDVKKKTGDNSAVHRHYPALRIGIVGPRF
jgi:hypothetical protein